MGKIKIYKKHILIAAYVVLIIVELFFYVPYHSIQIFKSQQNVPHTQITGSGYATMTNITYNKAQLKNNERAKAGKRVDTSQLFMNVSITTIIFIALYVLLLKNENGDNKTKVQNDFLEAKKATEKMFEKEYQLSLEESMLVEPPYLDVNALAFADEETIKEAQKQYVQDLYFYFKNRLDRE